MPEQNPLKQCPYWALTFVALALVLTLFTGCALWGEAVVAEGVLGRAVLRNAARGEIALMQRSGLRLAANEILLADATALRSAMAGVRVRSSLIGRPELFMAHESTPFAEVVSGNTIRMLRSNQQLQLPGTLHVVRNRALLRLGPGKDYQVLRMLDRDQLVLVEATRPGWCRVQLGDQVGWMAAASLVALLADEWEHRRLRAREPLFKHGLTPTK
ncbi:MAG: hypothetical protein KDC02_25600 [Flavobacteriales bacterium]|nr:hypothetical protein [Flavobacteriales bacterium]